MSRKRTEYRFTFYRVNVPSTWGGEKETPEIESEIFRQTAKQWRMRMSWGEKTFDRFVLYGDRKGTEISPSGYFLTRAGAVADFGDRESARALTKRHQAERSEERSKWADEKLAVLG